MNQQRIRRIAGGTEPAPREIRAAAIRVITGSATSEDIKLLNDYDDETIRPT